MSHETQKDDESSCKVENVTDHLSTGFETLRAEALAEGYRHIERLATDWDAGTTRFDRDGEALVAVRVSGVLAGIGGLTADPVVSGALRMRRFYVRPSFRRSGIARRLASALLARAGRGRTITVNAAAGSVPFWEALGFVPDPCDGHSHLLARATSGAPPPKS